MELGLKTRERARVAKGIGVFVSELPSLMGVGGPGRPGKALAWRSRSRTRSPRSSCRCPRLCFPLGGGGGGAGCSLFLWCGPAGELFICF